MVHMLSLRTQPTHIAKVKAHVNIQGNESADKLAKQGTKLLHRLPQSLYEHVYSTPYHLHKDTWPDMNQTPYKGPIRHLLPYIIQHDKTHNLELIAQNFPNIFKWNNDPNIDLDTSIKFWTHPSITDPQHTCILKFRYNQYMGNARKQLFFGPTLFPQITCFLCNSTEPDTWKHILLSCTQQNLHALHIKRHNKAVFKFRKLLLSCQNTQCYLLMNAGIYNNSLPDNTVPPWLLPCICNTPRCHCNAHFKPDLLCVRGIPYQHPPPTTPTSSITIQFIEFTFCNDHLPIDAISRKINKYASLIHDIQARGWQVTPLIVLTAKARATIHISTMTLLHDTLYIPK
jgi:hypothetical protein